MPLATGVTRTYLRLRSRAAFNTKNGELNVPKSGTLNQMVCRSPDGLVQSEIQRNEFNLDLNCEVTCKNALTMPLTNATS